MADDCVVLAPDIDAGGQHEARRRSAAHRAPLVGLQRLFGALGARRQATA
jgi:hypothetical protein